MIFSSELKRNKKRIFGAKSGYPSRILVRRAEFRSSDIRKCNSDSLSVSFCLSSYRARFIIKFMASSGNRTLYVPDRQRDSEHVSCSRTGWLQEKSCPLPSYGSHSRTPDRAESRGTRYSDHEGISLAPGTRESFTTRARVANIDEASQFAYIIRLSSERRNDAEGIRRRILATIKSIYKDI